MMHDLSRYFLTYEEWLVEAVADPEAYGLTLEEALAMKEANDNKSNNDRGLRGDS